MPRSFDLSADYPSGVETVYAALSDRRYWIARLADSGADTATLDTMQIGADGTIEVATTQALHRDRLPALAAQFHRGDLEIVRHEKWGPVRGGTTRTEVRGKVRGAPVSVSGDAVLAPTDTGSRLSITATVSVDIPLVGGKIEGFIGAQLAELMAAEQRFTSSWVAHTGQ